jgi:hypothetical protein
VGEDFDDDTGYNFTGRPCITCRQSCEHSLEGLLAINDGSLKHLVAAHDEAKLEIEREKNEHGNGFHICFSEGFSEQSKPTLASLGKLGAAA